jgi:uncharacterized protein YbbC (DUF1343 family)
MRTSVPVLSLLLSAACAQAPEPPATSMSDDAADVRPGVEVFLAELPPAARGSRVGLITNHSAIDRAGTPDVDLIAQHP